MSVPQATKEKRSSDKNASPYQNLLAFLKKKKEYLLYPQKNAYTLVWRSSFQRFWMIFAQRCLQVEF